MSRRYFLTALLALVALAWLGVDSAKAQQTFPDQGSAYAACQADMAAHPYEITEACWHQPWGENGWYYCRGWNSNHVTVVNCNNGQGSYVYPIANSCSARPSQVTPFLPLSGSTQCWNGCVTIYRQNGDDETSTRSTTGAVCGSDFKEKCPAGSFWNGYMGVCQPIEPDCPEGQKREGGQCKPENQCPEGQIAVTGGTPGAVQQGALYCKPAENECPAGNVKSPEGKCLPGENQCAAGEARRENGTCGKDSDGDGKADEDDDDPNNDPDKDTASGGDSCETPPSCSGSAIACMQVKIQWRIDCNTRKNRNISGGTCNAVPVCTGKSCDAMEYSSLMMQWRTACALEKGIKVNVAGQTPGGDGGEKIKPDFEGLVPGGDSDDGQGDIFVKDTGTPVLDEGKIVYGVALNPVLVEVEGQQFRIPDMVMQFIPILKWLIIAAAALVAIAIIRGQ